MAVQGGSGKRANKAKKRKGPLGETCSSPEEWRRKAPIKCLQAVLKAEWAREGISHPPATNERNERDTEVPAAVGTISHPSHGYEYVPAPAPAESKAILMTASCKMNTMNMSRRSCPGVFKGVRLMTDKVGVSRARAPQGPK